MPRRAPEEVEVDKLMVRLSAPTLIESGAVKAERFSRYFSPVEMRKLGLEDLPRVHGIVRSRVAKVVKLINEGGEVTEELMEADPSINDAIKSSLQATAGIEDRLGYHAAVFGYTPDKQANLPKAGDELGQERFMRQQIAKGHTRFTAGLEFLAATVNALRVGFNKPYLRGPKAVSPDLVQLAIRRKLKNPSAPVIEEFNEAGDNLYGSINLSELRVSLRAFLKANNINGIEDLQKLSRRELNQLFENSGLGVGALELILRAFDSKALSNRSMGSHSISNNEIIGRLDKEIFRAA